MSKTWLLIGGFVVVTGCGAPEAPSGEDASALLEEPPAPEPAARAQASCRCAELPLATYFARAEVVLMGELLGSEARETDHVLEVLVTEQPWKASQEGDSPVEMGDTLRYATAGSSASCGIDLREGATYVLFVPERAAPDAEARLQSCDGTRILRDETGAERQGFPDVPVRFVASQLDALSGLDYLSRAVPDAPDPSDPTNDSLIGLLDIPAFSHGGWVSVRERPDVEASVITRAESYEDLEAREVSYEVGAAVVLARTDGWYRVRLADGRAGWLSPEEAGTWFPYSELPIRRLAYLTAAWSGHVWPEPGAGIPARSSRRGSLEREEYPVEIFESTDLAGTTWFRIGVLGGNPCEGGEVNSELGGWIPGHGVGGRPTVWYYSRGC